MQPKKVNICLHNIVADPQGIETIYDITRSQLNDLVRSLQTLRSKSIIDSYDIFFDDGYKSAIEIVQTMNLGISNANVHMAIITGDVGKPGKLTKEDIISLAKNGFAIDSHSVSHAALAIFIDDSLQPSPADGQYRNTPRGKEKALSAQEIKYQLVESGQTISQIAEQQPISFVLPYGLYNKEVVYQAANTNYRRLYTCDASFDSGRMLAPRLLITQDNVNRVEQLVAALPEYPKLLI